MDINGVLTVEQVGDLGPAREDKCRRSRQELWCGGARVRGAGDDGLASSTSDGRSGRAGLLE
jgi:hypothetical protein